MTCVSFYIYINADMKISLLREEAIDKGPHQRFFARVFTACVIATFAVAIFPFIS